MTIKAAGARRGSLLCSIRGQAGETCPLTISRCHRSTESDQPNEQMHEVEGGKVRIKDPLEQLPEVKQPHPVSPPLPQQADGQPAKHPDEA